MSTAWIETNSVTSHRQQVRKRLQKEALRSDCGRKMRTFHADSHQKCSKTAYKQRRCLAILKGAWFWA